MKTKLSVRKACIARNVIKIDDAQKLLNVCSVTFQKVNAQLCFLQKWTWLKQYGVLLQKDL